MRDPNRIPDVINLLYQAWCQHPDMRLAQLVNNAAHEGGWKGGPDVYHCEDDKVMAGLIQMLQGDLG